jgi:hypothetical protein
VPPSDQPVPRPRVAQEIDTICPATPATRFRSVRGKRPGASEEHERHRGFTSCAGAGRARRGRARKTGEVRTRVSLHRRMRECATSPLRSCAVSTRIVLAPAKSTRGAARSQLVRGSRAGAAWPGTENRRDSNARFLVAVAFVAGRVRARTRKRATPPLLSASAPCLIRPKKMVCQPPEFAYGRHRCTSDPSERGRIPSRRRRERPRTISRISPVRPARHPGAGSALTGDVESTET